MACRLTLGALFSRPTVIGVLVTFPVYTLQLVLAVRFLYIVHNRQRTTAIRIGVVVLVVSNLVALTAPTWMAYQFTVNRWGDREYLVEPHIGYICVLVSLLNLPSPAQTIRGAHASLRQLAAIGVTEIVTHFALIARIYLL